jgi:CspA family cold shock protein
MLRDGPDRRSAYLLEFSRICAYIRASFTWPGLAIRGVTGFRPANIFPIFDSGSRPQISRRGNFRLRTTYMQTGTVKFYNGQKGFGFIQPEDGSKDVFVHISALDRAGLGGLVEGQKVEFELETGRDGRTSAANLKAL